MEWMTDWQSALDRARAEKKPIIVDVYQDNCGGCERLAHETFADPDLAQEIEARFIPVKLHLYHDRAVVRDWGVFWTPTVYFADRTGKRRYESINYLPAEDMRDVLDIGEARVAMRWQQFDVAISRLTDLEIRRPHGSFTAEAMYWRGIAEYFCAHKDPAVAKRVWSAIRERFPESEWAHRQP